MILLPAAVVDTNAAVSAFLAPNSPPAIAIASLRKSHRLLGSAETVAELQDVFMRDKFGRISREKREYLLLDFIEALELVEPHITIAACRHPKDDKFLSLAVSANAELILTGDKDLLVLHPFQEVDIISPTSYLGRLGVEPSTR